MKIELLYFDGCPNYRPLLAQLRDVLAREGIEDEIELCRVESLEMAEEGRFLGSPTVRIDGEDIDPGAHARTDFGLKCRLYPATDGKAGVPPERWIVETIRNHRMDPRIRRAGR